MAKVSVYLAPCLTYAINSYVGSDKRITLLLASSAQAIMRLYGCEAIDRRHAKLMCHAMIVQSRETLANHM